ncbi:MAG: hypothetical protein ACYCTZ_09765 [Candidatus Dormibacteria bacterium]
MPPRPLMLDLKKRRAERSDGPNGTKPNREAAEIDHHGEGSYPTFQSTTRLLLEDLLTTGGAAVIMGTPVWH